MEMKKIKYLHILWMYDLKFYKNLVEMINKEKIYFNKEEHYFITPFKRVYENLKEYKNVCLVEEKNMLNRYGEKASFIFLHPLSLKKRQVIRIPNKIAKKIIWRTWGHDIRPLDIKNDNIFVANIKRILNKMYVNKVHKFKAIGIADDVDRVNVENVFGNDIPTCILGYGYDIMRYPKLEKIANEKIKENTSVRVLVGHNSAKADRHFEIFEYLKKYKKENITVVLPLAYGDAENAEKIKEEALNIFGKNKVEFWEDFVTYEEYARRIHGIDIAIIDNIYSNGLGNWALLTFFKKKIYINKKGNIAQSCKRNNVKIDYTENIQGESFEQFSKYYFDPKLKMYEEISAQKVCEIWKHTLDQLKTNGQIKLLEEK